QQIKNIQRKSESYNEWLHLREQVDLDIQSLETKLDQFRSKQKRWEKAKEAFALCKERTVLHKQLRKLPSRSDFPENGVQRLTDLEQNILSLTVEVENDQLQLEEIKHNMDEIWIHPTVHFMHDDIEMLKKQGERWIEKQERMASFQTQIEFKKRELEHDLQQLGSTWTEQRLHECDVSLSQKEIFREHRQSFDQLRAELYAVREMKQTKRSE